jgi:cation diffusion facilitator CzcD-associated flavoprotein CzcO/acetyl esterase/lipase
MASWQAQVASFVIRRRLRPALADMSDIARVRRVFGQPLPVPRGVRYLDAVVGGVSGEWVIADGQPDDAGSPATTLLYVHGGGFVGCSPRSHRPLTAALAKRGMRVFVPDYRLAPEHPFPAPLDDVLAAWRGLCAERDAAGGKGRLVVGGDSAGGNLALALMVALRDAAEPGPAAAALFSPATDLTGASESLISNTGRDAMFHGKQLRHLADAYLAGADAAHPLASPLLADLTGLAPLLIHVGAEEVLRDDSLRLAAKARAAGVRVDLRVWPGMPHVWQLLQHLPEGRQSVAAAAKWLREADLAAVEEVDVVIVGAGLSGIGAAAHLQRQCPALRYAIVESRDASGGTWDLFRYPGVRSDSDMHTLGYVFKPWAAAQAIAAGPDILAYVRETAAENAIDAQIRYRHRVVGADWSSPDSRWTVDLEVNGQRRRLSCKFLHFCSGYYRYDRGHSPEFAGAQQFKGRIVQPQFWPADLDHRGARVVVIGSGATAMTLVPEMAKTAAKVTLLQRSPTYVVALPSVDRIAESLKRWLPAMWAHRLVRFKNIAAGIALFRLARMRPTRFAARLLGLVEKQLGVEQTAAHFTPKYKPWDQRICVVPDGDLYQAIQSGRAEVVTDHIATFTERGIQLASGREIEADIVVSATGLALELLGGAKISIDGLACDLSKTLVYKGLMFSGIPNLASTFGYTNASWTLKADLTARYVCRLLNHLQHHHLSVVTPSLDPAMAVMPFLDFTSGYVQRALSWLPKQGVQQPWRLHQNYLLDLLALRLGRIKDGTLGFGVGRVERAVSTDATQLADAGPGL